MMPRNSSCTSTANNNLYVLLPLTNHFQSIHQRGQHYHSSTFLVIMGYRDFKGFSQLFLYFKTFRSCYILEINTAKYRGYVFHGIYDSFSILVFQTDRECVYARKFFKKHALAFHNRQGCLWPNIS